MTRLVLSFNNIYPTKCNASTNANRNERTTHNMTRELKETTITAIFPPIAEIQKVS